MTPLPVIGVPVPLKHLDGMDSLLSIVQMPAGVPVATVSVGGARNAGLLAVRMLAAGGDGLADNCSLPCWSSPPACVRPPMTREPRCANASPAPVGPSR